VLSKKRIDPRVKRTRQLLQRAFLELVEEKGLGSVTVRDIAERATVNRATFYAHFEDKYALFDHIVRESFKQALESKLPPAAELSRDNLKQLVVVVCEHLAQLGKSCASSDEQVRPLVETQIQDQLYQLVLGWTEKRHVGGGDLPAKPQIAASFLSWAIFGAGLEWSHDPSLGSAQEMADQVLLLMTKGCLLGI
jgi:AcrR family transcriptional regulator